MRVSKCCISIITKPTANSTAEKIKKKNVKETRFKLSYTNPTINVKAYRVIQMSSAVSRRWSEVFVWVIKVLESIKNKINKRFKSPKNKTNLKYLYTVNHVYSFFLCLHFIDYSVSLHNTSSNFSFYTTSFLELHRAVRLRMGESQFTYFKITGFIFRFRNSFFS